DHPHSLTGEVDAPFGPRRGDEPSTLKVVETFELVGGVLSRGEAAHGSHEVVGKSAGAAMGLDDPAVQATLEVRGGDAGIELDVPSQVELVGHVVEVTQDLRLPRVSLCPLPLLLELLREGIRVVHALDVAAAPRVTVPVPGAADARR